MQRGLRGSWNLDSEKQLEHLCRRCTLIVDVRLATRPQSMWNGADKQAGIEVVAFSIVVPLERSSWVGRIQFLVP